MEYSDYSLEQLKGDFPKYKFLCNAFFQLASDADTLEKLQSILYHGGWQNYSVSTGLERKDNPHIEAERRLGMARLLLAEPETFQFFVDHQINLFHGTNANALPGILQYGLNSVDALNNMGMSVETGETWSRIEGKRAFVSFSDVYDLSEGYSLLPPQKRKLFSSFEVMIGISEEEARKQRVVNVRSDLSEVGIYGGIPLESIQCICVPASRINFVKRMMKDSQIPVLAMPDPSEKFYLCEELFSQEKYERFAHRQEKRASKTFAREEVQQMAMSRSLLKIKEALEKYQSLFWGGENKIERSI